MFKHVKKLAATAALTLWASAPHAADKLDIDVYNPGANSLFPVTSTLISGPSETILVDAQFQTNDAAILVQKIKESGKKLKAVYISHGDPDFYFGLETIKATYPDVNIFASPETLAKIKKSYQGKLAFWGPKLGENAPKQVILPAPLPSDTLHVDGQDVKIIGLKGHDPKHTFVWVPSVKTAIASISVFENQHVWIADSQTQESRQKWFKTLDIIEGLKADKIIPGHYLGSSDLDIKSVKFTRQYIKAFEEAAATSKTSDELIAKITQKYPNYANKGTLVLSAKVIMGEMKWGS